MSDSPGLVDFVIRLVNSVLQLPDGQVKFFEEFKLQENCITNPNPVKLKYFKQLHLMVVLLNVLKTACE